MFQLRTQCGIVLEYKHNLHSINIQGDFGDSVYSEIGMVLVSYEVIATCLIGIFSIVLLAEAGVAMRAGRAAVRAHRLRDALAATP